MTIEPDELYRILDRAKLTPGDLLSRRKSTVNLVNEIRSSIVEQILKLVESKQ